MTLLTSTHAVCQRRADPDHGHRRADPDQGDGYHRAPAADVAMLNPGHRLLDANAQPQTNFLSMPKALTPRVDVLVGRVNAYCKSKHGSKVALAEYLQIPKQALHSILNGTYEPGGEKVLAMIEWMEKHATEQPAASTRNTNPRPNAPQRGPDAPPGI